MATESVGGAAYAAVTDEQVVQRSRQNPKVFQLAPAEAAVSRLEVLALAFLQSVAVQATSSVARRVGMKLEEALVG